jgi:phosphomannomutase
MSSQSQIDPDIFKAYDVRGIYPTELSEDTAYRIGRAFVQHLGGGPAVLRHAWDRSFDALRDRFLRHA